MTIKKLGQFIFFVLSFFIYFSAYARSPVIQINTRLTHLFGKPEWLLIVRDMETGKIIPYLYDIHNFDNFWIAFTEGRSYRVTVSELKFGTCAKIKNFCKLENGIITDKSLMVSIRGAMTPFSNTIMCHVRSYRDGNSF